MSPHSFHSSQNMPEQSYDTARPLRRAYLSHWVNKIDLRAKEVFGVRIGTTLQEQLAALIMSSLNGQAEGFIGRSFRWRKCRITLRLFSESSSSPMIDQHLQNFLVPTLSSQMNWCVAHVICKTKPHASLRC